MITTISFMGPCIGLSQVVSLQKFSMHNLCACVANVISRFQPAQPGYLSRHSGGSQVGRLDFCSRQGQVSFLLSTASRLALGAHTASHRMDTDDLYPEIKRPGRGSEHTPLSSAEVKNDGDILPHSYISSRYSA
jgi:hypothetical protein